MGGRPWSPAQICYLAAVVLPDWPMMIGTVSTAMASPLITFCGTAPGTAVRVGASAVPDLVWLDWSLFATVSSLVASSGVEVLRHARNGGDAGVRRRRVSRSGRSDSACANCDRYGTADDDALEVECEWHFHVPY
jgi:hypothetical protein